MVLDEISYNTEDLIDGYIYLYTFFPYMITKKFQVYFSVDNQNYEKCKIKYIGKIIILYTLDCMCVIIFS